MAAVADSFSVATVRAPTVAKPSRSVTLIFHLLSVRAHRLVSPDNEFPNLSDISGDEDDEGGSLVNVSLPMTPHHRGGNAAPSAWRLYPVTPRTLGQTPGHPHSGLHKISHRDGPAGNKKRYAARDVWHFFVENDKQRRECLLCR